MPRKVHSTGGSSGATDEHSKTVDTGLYRDKHYTIILLYSSLLCFLLGLVFPSLISPSSLNNGPTFHGDNYINKELAKNDAPRWYKGVPFQFGTDSSGISQTDLSHLGRMRIDLQNVRILAVDVTTRWESLKGEPPINELISHITGSNQPSNANSEKELDEYLRLSKETANNLYDFVFRIDRTIDTIIATNEWMMNLLGQMAASDGIEHGGYLITANKDAFALRAGGPELGLAIQEHFQTQIAAVEHLLRLSKLLQMASDQIAKTRITLSDISVSLRELRRSVEALQDASTAPALIERTYSTPEQWHIEAFQEMLDSLVSSDQESRSFKGLRRNEYSSNLIQSKSLTLKYPIPLSAFCGIIALCPILYIWARLRIRRQPHLYDWLRRPNETVYKVKKRQSANPVSKHFWSMLRKLRRPAVRVGYTRVEWTCNCDNDLYMDFKSTNLHAIEELVAILEGKGIGNQTQSDQSGIQSNVGTSPHSPPSSAGDSSSASRVGVDSTNAVAENPPRHTDESSTTREITDSTSFQLSTNPSFLELCVNVGERSKTLGEIDLTEAKSDAELFRKLRESYLRLRSFRAKFWLLKPSAVHYVRFSVEDRHRVGILQSPLAVPPKSEVDAKRYTYTPCPLDGELPIGDDLFLHYLTCSNDLTSLFWMRRLPRKLETSILTWPGKVALGWGVHINEGPNFVFISWINFVLLLLIGLAALLWNFLEKDFQGAFGFGCWLIGVLNSLMMCYFFKWRSE